MVEPDHEFDDGADDEVTGPLLPPEDRLWRHPSEMSAVGQAASEEVLDARRRWLSATPSRSGAWTAGVLGAVLATGVVLIGTHLTSWIDHPAKASKVAVATVDVLPTTTTLANDLSPKLDPRTSVTGLARRVANGMALVEGWSPSGARLVANGVIVNNSGMIAVPISVAGASGLQVTVSAGQFPAQVVGVDPMSEIAVLHIGTTDLAPIALARKTALQTGEWMGIEWLGTGQIVVSTGAVRWTSPSAAPERGVPSLFTAFTATADGFGQQLLGAAVVDYAGHLLGLVTGVQGGKLYEIPAPLLRQIVKELIVHHQVVHGWLGIEGRRVHIWMLNSNDVSKPLSALADQAPSGYALGVEVTQVDRGSAAQAAGLKKGDVIEAVDGRTVSTVGQLQADLYVCPPGKRLELRIERHGRIIHKEVTLKAAA